MNPNTINLLESYQGTPGQPSVHVLLVTSDPGAPAEGQPKAEGKSKVVYVYGDDDGQFAFNSIGGLFKIMSTGEWEDSPELIGYGKPEDIVDMLQNDIVIE